MNSQAGPQLLDEQVQQRLLGIRQALLTAGQAEDPEQALPLLEQAQQQLQQMLDEHSGHIL